MADHTKAAAEIIAADARMRAARFSDEIPASIRVSRAGDGWEVTADAPSAYPNEVAGVRHPVFGNRSEWVLNQHRPFLGPAADAKADAAAEEIAKSVDDWAHERGFH